MFKQKIYDPNTFQILLAFNLTNLQNCIQLTFDFLHTMSTNLGNIVSKPEQQSYLKAFSFLAITVAKKDARIDGATPRLSTPGLKRPHFDP